MTDIVDIPETEKQYKDEWLLFEVLKTGEQDEPLKGRLLCHDPDRAVVQARHSRSVVFVLDTGASLTVLSPEVLAVIGAPAAGLGASMRILTAGGSTEAHRYQLSSLDLYGECLGPVDILSSPLPWQIGAEGIPGLDILRHFDVTLDFERGELTLLRIRPGQVREPTPAYQAPPARAA